MRRRIAIGVLLAGVLSAGVTGQDAAATVAAVKKAMGADALKSITYSGAAATGNFGQSKNIAGPLAMTAIAGYRRAIDLDQPYSRAIGTTMPPTAPGAPAPQPGTFNQGITPTASWAQQIEIWLTPWGFLKGAETHSATAQSRRVAGSSFTVLTWSPAQKAPSGQPYRVVGYVNDKQLIERVETWIEHPVAGDLHVEQTFSDYRDVNGMKVPGRIVQKRAGMQTFEATVNEAMANPENIADLLQPPAAPAVRAAAGKARLPRRRRWSRRSWRTASSALPAATSPLPWTSRITWSCWRADRTRLAASR